MTCKKSGIYYIKGYQSNNNDQVKHLASVKEYMNACVIWTDISPEHSWIVLTVQILMKLQITNKVAYEMVQLIGADDLELTPWHKVKIIKYPL